MRIFVLITTILITAGCSGHAEQEVHVTMKNTQTYTYDFGICGDEEGVSISVPPAHAVSCEILRDSTTYFCSVLQYKTETGYSGTDKVEVITNTGSDGAGRGELNTVTFYFTVTN